MDSKVPLARLGAPSGSTSPATSRTGPTRLSRSDERLPSTTGLSTPPPIARNARGPGPIEPTSTTWPAPTGCTAPSAIFVPSMVRSASPTSATYLSTSKRSLAPNKVISSNAASSTLPTARLASRAARESAGPARDTPRRAIPTRPRSLDRREGPRGEDPHGTEPRRRRSAAGASRRLRSRHARLPGIGPGHRPEIMAKGGTSGSNSRRAVRPTSCQPPGVSIG